MAINTSKNKDGIFAEINITPLTDIFLVLLIIMMMVAPMFQSVDNNITIPEINSGVSMEESKAVVAITQDGIFYINGERIQDTQLTDKLVAILPTLTKKEVVVRADERTKSSEVMKVMHAAQAAEYEKLTIAGEPLSKKEQKSLDDGARAQTNENEHQVNYTQPQQETTPQAVSQQAAPQQDTPNRVGKLPRD